MTGQFRTHNIATNPPFFGYTVICSSRANVGKLFSWLIHIRSWMPAAKICDPFPIADAIRSPAVYIGNIPHPQLDVVHYSLLSLYFSVGGRFFELTASEVGLLLWTLESEYRRGLFWF